MKPKSEHTAVKKQQPKARHTPRPVPVNSGAFIDSPENVTTRVKVMRWCDLSGKPTLFLVTDVHGHDLGGWFPRESDALARAEALELELSEPEQQQ
jgi:hypothetical protein